MKTTWVDNLALVPMLGLIIPMFVYVPPVLLNGAHGENIMCTAIKRYHMVQTDIGVTSRNVIATYFVQSHGLCSLYCGQNVECKSFNYVYRGEGERLCELNNVTLEECPDKRKQKDGHAYYVESTNIPMQVYGSQDNPAKSCFEAQQCHEKEGQYWIAFGNNQTVNVFCKYGMWRKIAGDLCVEPKGENFGEIQFNANYSVLIEKVKLVHKRGYVGCSSSAASNWGCHAGSSTISIVITDIKNRIIYPSNRLAQVNSKGKYSLPGFNSSSPEILFTDVGYPKYLKDGEELRIWYGEDLFNYTEGDNHGSTCMDVWVYML